MQDIGRVLETTRRLRLFSPRALQPGQTLTLERDDYGLLRRLTFTLSPEETYVYEVRGDALVAWQQPVAREMRLRKFEGRIDETVDDAIREAGGDYRLTLKFADVFAYDVDFLTEVQPGDRFSLLVEEQFADGQFLGYGEILYGRYEGQRAAGVAVCYRSAGASRERLLRPEGPRPQEELPARAAEFPAHQLVLLQGRASIRSAGPSARTTASTTPRPRARRWWRWRTAASPSPGGRAATDVRGDPPCRRHRRRATAT